MSRKSRIADLRKAKDRRAKKLAVGGVVLLAVVLAVEVPKIMKSNGGGSSTPPAATTTTTATTAGSGVSTPPQTTAPGTSAVAAAASTTNTPLPNSELPPRRAKSQLYSFSLFAGKDPFVQQVVDVTAGQPDPSSSSGSSSSGSVPTLTASVSSATSGDATAAASNSSSPVRTLAASDTVKLQVNGRVQTVRVGATFPSSNPVFKLVSVAGGVARIGIASGGYASGAQTVTLAAGKSLTLVDTADGTHYKIQLLAAS
jgi:hypothetical protein